MAAKKKKRAKSAPKKRKTRRAAPKTRKASGAMKKIAAIARGKKPAKDLGKMFGDATKAARAALSKAGAHGKRSFETGRQKERAVRKVKEIVSGKVGRGIFGPPADVAKMLRRMDKIPPPPRSVRAAGKAFESSFGRHIAKPWKGKTSSFTNADLQKALKP